MSIIDSENVNGKTSVEKSIDMNNVDSINAINSTTSPNKNYSPIKKYFSRIVNNLDILIKKKHILLFLLILLFLILLFLGYIIYDKYFIVNDYEWKNVTVALKWVHQSQFAGNYVAIDKGFYSVHKIDAQLIPYNLRDSPIDLVASGNATFGIASASEILIARSQGIPVKAIAVIYQINPVCAYSLKSSGITQPKDFIGKRVGLEKGINVEYEYIAMMNYLDIDRSQITELGIGFNGDELLNGDVDVSTGYVINEPYYTISKGIDVNIIMVEDYGINTYADVLFTTENLIAENYSLVDNFVQATLDGWQYALEHEEETVGIVMRYAKDKDLSHEKYALKTSLPLISTGDIALGFMDEEGWINVKKTLLLQKERYNLSYDDINVSDCYDDAFINNRRVWHKI
ncbi:MAG: ABC transporter substrate-binding protein [Candidatus Woesearchaeota archaeon]